MTEALSAPTVVPADAPLPRAPAPAAYLGAALSLSVAALGVIGIRDGIVAAGWVGGSMWTANAVNWIDGLSFAPWMIPAGVIALLLGVVLVIMALAPRRTTAVPVAGQTSVVISHRDIARIAQSAARTVPGVIDANADSTRRTVTVRARTLGQGDSTITSVVSQAVSASLAALATQPKIVVRIRPGGQS